jgi:hypothetical protein
MKPNDYYRLKSAEIKEADIRLVAAVMSEHVGQENAVRLESLVARSGLGERQVRDILEVLVKDYKWPIGAHAGKAGRWIIENEQERWHVANELLSRENELRARRKVIEQAHIPAILELDNQVPQMGLF